MEQEGYRVSSERQEMELGRVAQLLGQTFWANNRPLQTIALSMQNSLCFGVFRGDFQVAFARVITDYATFFYISDVIVDEACRGKGLGKMLMDTIMTDERLRGFKTVLSSRDAQGFYAQYGYELDTTRFMKKGNWG